MFYLTTISTRFIYSYMVKDHSDSERGRKEMFYLTTHSTRFIYGYMVTVVREETCCRHMGCSFWLTAGRKEGNVLFNDALNSFYLRLYGVRHMLRATQIVREETRCRQMGYSF